MRMVLNRVQVVVVISTMWVVISSSKDRVQGSQPCQHLPPVGPGSSSGHTQQAGLLGLGCGLLGILLLGELVREVKRSPLLRQLS